MGKKKGKGKKEEGDQQPMASGSVPEPQKEATPPAKPTPEPVAEPQQQAQGKKKGKQQQPKEASPAPVVEQPAQAPPQPAVEQQQQSEPGEGKGKKKGKKQQQQEQQPKEASPAPIAEPPAPIAEQPLPQEPQPADVQPQGKRKGKKQPQQIQEPAGPPPKPQQQRPQKIQEPAGPPPKQQQQRPQKIQEPAGPPPKQQQQRPQQTQRPTTAPEPSPAAAQPSAWGRGQQQQQPPYGRGQAPPAQQQPQGPWGAGRGQPRGRGDGAGGPGPGQAPRPSQQPLEASVQQMRIGEQPRQQPTGRGSPRQQQSRTPSESSTTSQRSVPPAAQRPAPAVQRPAPAARPAAPKTFDLAIPRRKDLRSGGTSGIPCIVETNHLSLDFKPQYDTAVHYDVAITPDKPKRMMRPVWEEFKRQYLPRTPIAFDDYKNAYSPMHLQNDIGGEVQVAEDAFAKPRTYQVVVKFAAEVNLQALFTYMQSGGRTAVPQEALQCIDIVLRNASALRFVRVGRSYFSEPRGRIVSLGDGLELWHGFFQSAVIGWKPFLNVDVAHKGFPKPQPIIELFREMSPPRGDTLEINAYDTEKISKFLKSLKIQYEIPRQPASRKCYRVNALADVPGRAMFVHNENRTSVLDYFKNEKNYTIVHQKLPCLWVGPKDRKIYLPSELCTILPGQAFNRKLNEIQTAQMVRNAATDSNVRKGKIMDAVRNVGFNADPVVRAFGLNIGTEFERVKSRLLKPPDLEYGVQRPVTPRKGVWRAERFISPANLPQGRWAIINLDRRTRDDSLSNFARLLEQNCAQLGMKIEKPEQPFTRMDDRFDERRFEDTLRKFKNNKLLMVFVVVPDFPTNIYGRVKHTAEIKVGFLTQCIKSKTMFRMNPATVGNILLKVNAKLNGHNHTIARNFIPTCLREPCMIMGADVTHPSPDQTDIPSVAAVTASCDPRAFQYTFSWRLQDPRQEIIDDLEVIVVEQLKFFYRQSKGQQPRRIIFFRDGVSEGQFQEVMNMEVQAIRRACSKLGDGSYKPPITFLVVQKRHHTRFFPTKPEQSDDRNFNVRAGTVVDTDITHPTDLEYYLVSHASIQGVARPTKYRVLWDDSFMSEDELEELTYYLCHMFSRCTRSVSYPAPTYYAHLAAFRARVYLEGHPVNLDNLRQEQVRMTIKDEILRGLPMFFV